MVGNSCSLLLRYQFGTEIYTPSDKHHTVHGSLTSFLTIDNSSLGKVQCNRTLKRFKETRFEQDKLCPNPKKFQSNQDKILVD